MGRIEYFGDGVYNVGNSESGREMIQERVIYEFGETPVEVMGRFIGPCYNMKEMTRSSNPNEWISRLSRMVRRSFEVYGFKKEIIMIVVWNTGWGNYWY